MLLASAKFRKVMFIFIEYPKKCLNKGIVQTKIAFSMFAQSANFYRLYASPVTSSPNFSISAKCPAIFYCSLCQIPRKKFTKKIVHYFRKKNSAKAKKGVSENAEKGFVHMECRYCKKYKIPFPPQHVENAARGT
jgi:hypothetical protein